jgi:GWxTD domain-containing protein
MAARRYIRSVPLLCLLSFVLFYCKPAESSYPVRPVRSALNPDADLLDLQTLVYHVNDSVTQIYLKFNTENLLYKRTDTSIAFFARLKIYTEFRSADSPKKIADSSSFVLYDRSLEERINPKDLLTSYLCVLKRGDYRMDIYVSDENRHVRYKKSLSVNKLSRFSSQNFLILHNDSVHFGNQILVGPQYKIRYAYADQLPLGNEGRRYLRMKAYPPTGPALPPFSKIEKTEEAQKATDETFINLKDSHLYFASGKEALYQFSAEGGGDEGLSLFTVDESFPGVSNTREMIQCTRYIMSKDEYDKCLFAEDQKAAIDKFWLGIGGSQERARELLRKYYSRVKEANKHYSSYLPGWKTDRGMIYIVMGQPYSTFSGQDSETWVYGTEANPNALRFVFSKSKTARTENDFVLERSPFYRDPFHMAVEYWRQGLVFNDVRR